MPASYSQNPEDYVKIDLILLPWAKARGLLVSKESTEKEDRFIQIIDDEGDSYALRLNDLQDDGSMSIVISENAINALRVPSDKMLTKAFTTKLTDLAQILDSAYAVATSWMHERGHSRSQDFHDGNAKAL